MNDENHGWGKIMDNRGSWMMEDNEWWKIMDDQGWWMMKDHDFCRIIDDEGWWMMEDDGLWRMMDDERSWRLEDHGRWRMMEDHERWRIMEDHGWWRIILYHTTSHIALALTHLPPDSLNVSDVIAAHHQWSNTAQHEYRGLYKCGPPWVDPPGTNREISLLTQFVYKCNYWEIKKFSS